MTNIVRVAAVLIIWGGIRLLVADYCKWRDDRFALALVRDTAAARGRYIDYRENR